jgi:hypothetical protein
MAAEGRQAGGPEPKLVSTLDDILDARRSDGV